MHFFKFVLDQPLPDSLTSFVEEMDIIAARDKTIQWKLRGVISKCTYRLFSKYGNHNYAHDADVPFVKYFADNFAEMLLESHLQLMFKRKSGFVGSKTLNFNIKYVTAATKLQRTMEKLKPFIQNILYETVMPIMLVTHRDATLFHEDPIEYIRKQQDFTETLFMPKNTVIDLLQYLCSYISTPKVKGQKKQKRQPDFLFPFLGYCV
jgi:hypothetical protein